MSGKEKAHAEHSVQQGLAAKQKLLEEIEIKDHFIDETGNKVHYSWREMNLFIRAKYAYFFYKDESDFLSLDEDTLKNIKRNLDFIRKKIPEWRRKIVPVSREPYSLRLELDLPSDPPYKQDELIAMIQLEDHFVDERGTKQYYSYDEMAQLVEEKYRHLNWEDGFDLSVLDGWTLWLIADNLNHRREVIKKWRKQATS